MMEQVKLIVLDVDGTLTDGKIYIDNRGIETKAFNVKDGMAISQAIRYGLIVAIITGRKSDIVEHRGIQNKIETLKVIKSEHKLEWNQILYIGDDINDLKVMRIVGVSACPQDAAQMIKEEADIVSKFNGGEGAVREILDILFKEKGIHNQIINDFRGGEQ
jgi:3-deoxy-D-manno-octulosonate 8-phosphate phosphatase (KDO 8-P phosphatase)